MPARRTGSPASVLSASRDLTTDVLANLAMIRGRSHELLGPPTSTTPEELTRRLIGLNAQLWSSVYPSLWARGQWDQDSALDHALLTRRTLVRMRCMRGTLHIVHAEDFGRLISALRPVLLRSDHVLTKSAEKLRDRLRPEGETRQELKHRLGAKLGSREIDVALDVLERNGDVVRVDTAPSAQSLDGRLDRVNRPYRYVLRAIWLPNQDPAKYPGDEARAWLALRYLRSYGPVTEEDFAWWTGLPKAVARAAIAAVKEPVVRSRYSTREFITVAAVPLEADPHWLGEEDDIRLLPMFDSYTLGWRWREALCAPRHQRFVYNGPVVEAVILCNARVAGTWSYSRNERLAIRYHLFHRLPSNRLQGIFTRAAQRLSSLPLDLASTRGPARRTSIWGR